MFYHGEGGVAENHQTALSYFKTGAKRGDYSCYLLMTKTFFNDRNPVNARKCLSIFFEKRKANIDPLVECEGMALFHLVSLITENMCDIQQSFNEFKNQFAAIKTELTQAADQLAGYPLGSPNPSIAYNRYEDAQKWISELGTVE